MTKSAPRTRAPALWLPSKVSTEVARRCRTRCDKRHSGVNCKLVQMRLAVCGQGAGCGEKWLLHLPSEQLVHLGCPSACSTARTGRRAPERGSSSSVQKCLSFIFVALEFFLDGSAGTIRDTDYSGLGAPIPTPNMRALSQYRTYFTRPSPGLLKTRKKELTVV